MILKYIIPQDTQTIIYQDIAKHPTHTAQRNNKKVNYTIHAFQTT